MKKYERNLFYYKRLIYILFLFVFFLLNNVIGQNVVLKENNNGVVPDYSNIDLWAAHPWKQDNSDRVPKRIKKEWRDSMVDVFFIHPTTFTDKNFNHWNADILDKTLNDKTDKSTILYQASVFNGSCRVFSPRYRQVNIKAFYINPSFTEKYFDTAYADIKNAFEFYLNNYNKGRPIIIASHSQGTIHAARLLKDFFEGKSLLRKLVCAYIIGMPIPETYFYLIKPCVDSTKTGCFISWRTFKSGYTPDFVKKESFNAIVINPLNWKMDSLICSNKMNLGGVLRKFNKIVPHVVDAKVEKNILWSCKPKIFGNFFIRNKNYHIGDINLFYMNIRENIKCRISNYVKENNL